jgi:hypothetical protein
LPRTTGRPDDRTNGRTDERTNGRTDERTNGRTDERTIGLFGKSVVPRARQTNPVRPICPAGASSLKNEDSDESRRLGEEQEMKGGTHSGFCVNPDSEKARRRELKTVFWDHSIGFDSGNARLS